MNHFFNILFVIVSLLLSLPSTPAAEEVFYYHTDNFGTPMAMTDKTGKVVWRASELPFGEEYDTEENPIKNNHRFLGKELDKETGLIYMGARFLDPETGRFNRPDPVGVVDPFNGGKINQEILLNPQRLNRYAYGLNNPYRYVDQDGNSPVETDGTIALRNEANNMAARSIQRSKQFVDFAVTVGSAGIVGPSGRGSTNVRLRHFTNNRGAKGIMDSGVIKATDKNSVFAVRAKGKPGSARDVESALGIRPGRGNNYIEFNAKPSEFRTVNNPKTGATEKVFQGNVNLKGRDAKKHKNR